ncbi:MAG: peptidylprolyl isomerase [Clostridia bacterium]|nr:peptidylprolyl isomerase [Clostridia bacterium]
MKKILKITAILTVLSLLLCFMIGCSSAPAAMKYNGTVLTTNMYSFYLSRYKAQILASYNSGQDNESFWTQVLDEESGDTFADFFTDIVVDNIKINVICAELFDEYDLSLSKDVYQSIDSEIASLIDEYYSRAEFNLTAASFGVNDKILRDIYVMDAEIKALYSYLFGEGGIQAVTEAEKEQHYRDDYFHIKTIFINTTYDILTDEDGKYIYDEEGYVKSEDKTEEEIAAAKAKSEALKALLEAGEDFEGLIKEYSDDPANEAYPDGFYFTDDTTYYGNVIEVAGKLSEGEWGIAESEYGIHYVLKLPLEDKAYEEKKYEEFFSGLESEIVNEKFDKIISDRLEDVWVNEEEIAKYSIIAFPQNLEM